MKQAPRLNTTTKFQANQNLTTKSKHARPTPRLKITNDDSSLGVDAINSKAGEARTLSRREPKPHWRSARLYIASNVARENPISYRTVPVPLLSGFQWPLAGALEFLKNLISFKTKSAPEGALSFRMGWRRFL